MAPLTTVMPITTRIGLRAGMGAFGLSLLLLPRASLADAPPNASRPVCLVTGVTAPSQRASLGATQAARITSFPVGEGARVRQGELLVTLDDAVPAIRTAIARSEADSDLRVRLALAKWRQVQQVDATTERGRDRGLPGGDVEVVRLEYELAVFEQAQAARRWQQAQHQLDEYRITAPFDGHVRAHRKQVGEIGQAHEPLIELIRINPLRVTLACPVALAPFVMTGDRYAVTPADQNWSARIGTMTRVHRTIDDATQTFAIELTVDNEDELWRPGLKVSVDLYAPLPETLDRHTSRERAPR